MSELFADRLLDAIDRTGAPVCVGIDPVLENLPDAVRGKFADGLDENEAAVDAIFDFTTTFLKIVAPLVPCVKFQSALLREVPVGGRRGVLQPRAGGQELGLLVIGDVKRGDIGSTAAAYAAGHLRTSRARICDESASSRPTPSPSTRCWGSTRSRRSSRPPGIADKGLFVLVRTSNPGSAELQDVKLADGRTWSEMLADKLNDVAAGAGARGRSGYSCVGAVVGATQPHTMQSLRERLPAVDLPPARLRRQGATADMTRAAFKDGQGAVVSASRSILYAHADARYPSQFGKNWEKCVEQAVKDMKDDVTKVIGG